VLIVSQMPIRREVIEHLPALGLIVLGGIGFDGIDINSATEAGVRVANVPDYGVEEVADHAVTLMLMAMRRMTDFERTWRLEGWHTSSLPEVHRIRGKRLGIIGLGRIGQQVAARAAAFGMDISAVDPIVSSDTAMSLGVDLVSLDHLLERSDVVSLHCPLHPETRHIINESTLSAMKPGAILVNASRGGLVDSDALLGALDNGLAFAALDVLDGEPEPDLDHPLLLRNDVFVTPHMAWYSRESRRDLGVLSAEEAIRFLNNKPLRCPVN
jgi:D-3-phosphoglycerate dehydrogenase